MRLTIPWVAVAVPLQVWATVNLRTASYSIETFDPITENLSLKRSYSSRSIYKGWFGFGWCSELERRLELNLPDTIYLVECDSRRRFNRIQDLFIEADSGSERILPMDGGFVHYSQSGQVEQYDGLGRLKRIQPTKGTQWLFSYNVAGQINELRVGREHLITLLFDKSSNRILSLKPLGKEVLHFSYASENLIKVRQGLGILAEYRYDQFHNMTEVHQGQKVEKLTYDLGQDRVKTHQRRDGCVESFDYQVTNLKVRTSARVRCQARPEQLVQIEFQYQRQSSRKPTLSAVRTWINGQEIKQGATRGIAAAEEELCWRKGCY